MHPLLKTFIAVTSNYGRIMSENLLDAFSQPLPCYAYNKVLMQTLRDTYWGIGDNSSVLTSPLVGDGVISFASSMLHP